MRHLDKILKLAPYTTRHDLIPMLDRWQSPGCDIDSPITATLPSSDDTSYKLLYEFNADGELVFGELTAGYKKESDALEVFRKLGADLYRRGDVEDSCLPPLRRTGMAMSHLLAWGSWVWDDLCRLQAVVGISHSAMSSSERTRLAVSLHVGAHLPGYGPTLKDISTCQARGWNDFDRLAAPDLAGRTILIESSELTINPRDGSELGSSDSAFRIFR